MRVLVTWGSKRGGTEGIARTIGEALREAGYEVDLAPASEAFGLSGFDAVVIGGALYAGLWHRDAARFVRRRQGDLQNVPVWFFSSGPLGIAADLEDIPPTRQVETLMDRVGALGHRTFGGRLEADAQGRIAHAMTKTGAGDWRNLERVRQWAAELARALPIAEPGRVLAPPGGSVGRLIMHGAVGWGLDAAALGLLGRQVRPPAALVFHALAAVLIFAVVARHYFQPKGAREPGLAAFVFVGMGATLDLILMAGLVPTVGALPLAVFDSWLRLALVFGVTWTIGRVMLVALPPRTGTPPQLSTGTPH